MGEQGFGIALVDLASVFVPEQSDPLHDVAVGAEPDCVAEGPGLFLKSCPEGHYFSIVDFSRRLQRRWPDLSAK